MFRYIFVVFTPIFYPNLVTLNVTNNKTIIWFFNLYQKYHNFFLATKITIEGTDRMLFQSDNQMFWLYSVICFVNFQTCNLIMQSNKKVSPFLIFFSIFVKLSCVISHISAIVTTTVTFFFELNEVGARSYKYTGRSNAPFWFVLGDQ